MSACPAWRPISSTRSDAAPSGPSTTRCRPGTTARPWGPGPPRPGRCGERPPPSRRRPRPSLRGRPQGCGRGRGGTRPRSRLRRRPGPDLQTSPATGAGHQIDPAAFHRRDVRDETADAQRARGGGEPGLLVGQPVGGEPDPVALLVDEGEQQFALVAVGRGLSGHVTILRHRTGHVATTVMQTGRPDGFLVRVGDRSAGATSSEPRWRPRRRCRRRRRARARATDTMNAAATTIQATSRTRATVASAVGPAAAGGSLHRGRRHLGGGPVERGVPRRCRRRPSSPLVSSTSPGSSARKATDIESCRRRAGRGQLVGERRAADGGEEVGVGERVETGRQDELPVSMVVVVSPSSSTVRCEASCR